MIETEHGKRLDMNGVVVEAERRLKNSADLVTDTRNVNYVSDGSSFNVEVAGFDDVVLADVNDYAIGQTATRTSVGGRYASKLRSEDPELLAYNFNRRNEKPGKRMLRFLDETMRADLSRGYRRVSDITVLKACAVAISGKAGWEMRESSFTERRMSVKLVKPSLTASVAVGDEVSAGIIIGNSEVGSGALNIKLELLRLACLNGMVVPLRGLRKIHLGKKVQENFVELSQKAHDASDYALMLEMIETIDNLSEPEAFHSAVKTLSESTNVEIENPVAATQLLGKSASLSKEELEAMTNSMVRGGDSTMWGLLNALTDSARDIQDYDRKLALEAYAGDVAFGGQKAWNKYATAR